MKSSENKKSTNTWLYLATFIFFLLFFFYSLRNERQTARNLNERTVVFALDAGDWRIVNKLVSEGRLKNIKYLIDNGASGRLKSVEPLYTPPNMASLFSGKSPKKHGIFSHFDIADGYTKNQLYRNMKVKPLWRILEHKNITIGIVGFQEFDYAPRIDGTVVTGLYLIKKAAEHNDYFLSQNRSLIFLKYIPDFALVSNNILTNYSFLNDSEMMMKAYNLSPKFDSEITHVYMPLIIANLKRNENSSKRSDFEASEFSKLVEGVETLFDSNISAKFIFEYDMLSKEIALDLYKRHKPDMLFVYFAGTDVFSHNYYFEGWHLEDKDNEEQKLLNYYEIVDGYIGEFLNASEGNVRFFVVSDHGTQNLTLAEFTDSINSRRRITSHTQYGIFIAKGDGIKQGYKIENASIMDITPTLLYMYNQPVAEDFDGKVLLDIFEDSYTKHKPVMKISTYH